MSLTRQTKNLGQSNSPTAHIRQPGVVYGQPYYSSGDAERPGFIDGSSVRQNVGIVAGGSLDGSIWPGRHGGMIHGGPLSGSIIPGSEGGMIHGGPLSGSILPGAEGGMIHGGPLSGSIMPGNEGGMIHGGPLSGTFIPPR